MKVLVINLDRSPERLAHMQAELGRLGVAFERVRAFDGRTLTPAETTHQDGGLYPSEIGCFLSHRKCWEEIAAGDDPCAIVLEDDVHLSPAFGDFALLTDWIPADADIVKLETRPGIRTVVDQRTIAAGNRVVARLRAANLCTGGYLVTREAAARLLASSQKLSLPVDHFMFDPASPVFRSLDTYQLMPAICVQDQFLPPVSQSLELGSGLEADRTNRRRTGWSKIVFEAIRPLRQAREAALRLFAAQRRAAIPFQ